MEKIGIYPEDLISSDMIQDYITQLKTVIKTNYPDINDKKLQKIIEKKVTEKISEVPIVEFKNNYTGVDKKTTLIKWYKWYKNKKPITTEHGVCYKRHDESINLSASLLEYILNTRKYHKNKMFDCKVAGDKKGEIYHNIRQKVFKIFANSYYGATGNSKAIFYNLFTALSITGKGQSLITNAATSFEQFFADNFWFDDIDMAYQFISNVCHEERKFKDGKCLSKQIKKEKVAKRLTSKIYHDKDPETSYNKILKALNKVSKQDLNRIYYKNNFYEFIDCDKVSKKIIYILSNVDSFRDPNEVPEVIKDDIEELWTWMREFVYYPHAVFNHIPKCKAMERKTVVTVDTDSNMLNIEPFINFVVKKSKNKFSKDDEETIFKIVNLMAYCLGRMIGTVHERYTKECNVPEEKRPIINMKNEFLYQRMLLTTNKKNYAGRVLLQEGRPVAEKDSLDIKGLSIKKSNVNKNVGDSMQNILEENILKAKEINISTILKDLNGIERTIKESFNKGELTYSKPDKSNEPSTYKTPYQIQSVRGIIIWNALYPDKEITYPAQVNLIKLKINSLIDLDFDKILNALDGDKEEAERIFNVVDETIYQNEDLNHYGFSVIAIPKTEKKIPKWLIPFIDLDTITYDSLNNFNVILGSIGIKTVGNTVAKQYYSNIIDF